MLKEGLGVKRTFLACGYTDLRYGVDGLAALVQFGFKQDPFEEGTLFLFCGRRKDRINHTHKIPNCHLLLTARSMVKFD